MEFIDSLKPTSRGESHMTLRQLIFEWCYSSVRLKLEIMLSFPLKLTVQNVGLANKASVTS